MKNQLGCNLTKFAAIYSSLLMIRKGMKNYSGAASSPVGVGTAGGKQDGLRLWTAAALRSPACSRSPRAAGS